MRSWKALAWLAVLVALVAIVLMGLADHPERRGSERGGAASPSGATLPGAGDPARMLKDIPAERFAAVLRAARPRPVMVDFWASWCDPCRFEMPFITRLRAKYVGRIDFIGVNYQDGRGPADEFVREFKVNFLSYRDPDGAIGQAQGGISGMPTAIFFDADGQEIHRRTGAFPTEAAMEAILKRLL